MLHNSGPQHKFIMCISSNNIGTCIIREFRDESGKLR